MARYGRAKLVRPLDKRTHTTLDEIGRMGQGERRFSAWLYTKENDAFSTVNAGTELEEALRSKGFRFHRVAFLGKSCTPQQRNDVSRWLGKFIKRGLIVTFSEQGKHITHIRLTELGRTAGAFYHHFGLCSPKELDEAVKFSSYRQRKQMQSIKQLLVLRPEGQDLGETIYLQKLEAELEEQILSLQDAFLNHLMRFSPDDRGKAIKLASELRSMARQHGLVGDVPHPLCSTLGVRSELSVN